MSAPDPHVVEIALKLQAGSVLAREVLHLREELSQADTFGRGEFRVTTWAYEQAVRTMYEAKGEAERLRTLLGAEKEINHG